MAGMGSSWGRHAVRLPSLGGVLGPGLLLATDTAPAPQRRARPSAPGDGKWLVFGRAGGGIPCVCHLSMGCRVRTPAGHRHRPHPSAPPPLVTAAPRHRARPSAPRPPLSIERWQMAGMGSSWGRHTVRLPSLDGVPVPDSCWLPTSPPPLGTGPGTRHRRPSAPRPGLGTAPRLSTERLQMAAMGSSWGRHTVRLPSLGGVPVPDCCWPPTPRPPLSTAPAPQHREMANGWYLVELGAAYRAFAISRWGAGSGLLLATDTAPAPRTAPRPRHREMANGWYLVEMGAAYRAFAISRRGNPVGPG